jgi:Uma2 family endonuclease
VSTITKRLSVDQYDQMVEYGILPETNRFELINGKIVEKDVKRPPHVTATAFTRQAVERLLPSGWHVRQEAPVRIPNRRSEPEPDLSVVRGGIKDYVTRHPEPPDVALVVEVTRTTASKDRALARVYGPAGIPVYWIVNIPRRRLEVYPGAPGVAGAYPKPTILDESASVELVIDGQPLGLIAVADLLP